MANNKKSKKKVIIFSIIGALVIVLGALVIMGSKKEPVFTVQTEKTQHRTITQAVTNFRDDVRDGKFPGPDQTFR